MGENTSRQPYSNTETRGITGRERKTGFCQNPDDFLWGEMPLNPHMDPLCPDKVCARHPITATYLQCPSELKGYGR